MILHLLTDDKFADYAIEQFSSFSETSEFVVVAFTSDFKYIKNNEKVIYIKWNKDDIDLLISGLSKYSGVVFHGMFYPWQEDIINSLDKQKIAWMFWGGEIYGRSEVNETFLAPKTKFLLKLYNIKNILRGRKTENVYSIPLESYKKINFCLTDVNYEFDYAKKLLDNQMQMMWYNYYSIEDTVGSLMNFRSTGKDIFLGNSCTIENNFIEAFSIVKNLILNNSRVIVPLSYGSPWLKNILLKLGKLYFKKNFLPLIDFLPREEYNSYMTNCGVMIMNHYRPQAQGNIITGLWLGMRVFLSNKNMAYQYFKDKGIILYSIEDDLNKDKELNPLSDEEMMHNRAILYSLYSKESMLNATKNVIDHLS